MIFLSAQPNTIEFLWELEVQFYNFTRLGIDPSSIYALVARTQSNPAFESFARKTPCNVLFYDDTRLRPVRYISSLRPHLIAKFLRDRPEFTTVPIFYHDSDMIFRELPDFETLNRKSGWKLSDTRSYIGYEYIISKGADVLLDMCEIVGINPHLLRKMEMQSGGCQYLISGCNVAMWEKIERDCERLFHLISEREPQHRLAWMRMSGQPHERYNPVQIWCADMWAVLWNAWLNGYETRIEPELSFCWPTDSIHTFDQHKLFHNAGVGPDRNGELFYKKDYLDRTPFDEPVRNFSQDYASYRYYEEICRYRDVRSIYY